MKINFSHLCYLSLFPFFPQISVYMFYFLVYCIWPGLSVWLWVCSYSLDPVEITNCTIKDNDCLFLVKCQSFSSKESIMSLPPNRDWLLTRLVLYRPSADNRSYCDVGLQWPVSGQEDDISQHTSYLPALIFFSLPILQCS